MNFFFHNKPNTPRADQSSCLFSSLELTISFICDYETTFLSTDSRKEQRRKGKKRKSRFSHKEHEDPEIQAEIRKGNIVNILYDSSP
jgi:hypothetical protein